MIIEYHSNFSDDLSEAAKYLEAQEEKLGNDLIDVVEAACLKISGSPTQFGYIVKPVRHFLAQPFSYAIHFELFEKEDRIVFYGLFHTAMSPERWEERYGQ